MSVGTFRVTIHVGDPAADIGRTWIRVDGRAEVTLVLFGEPGQPAVLGAYTLEGLRLAVDPVARRLVPVRGLLLLAG